MNTFDLTLDLAKAKQRQQQTVFVRQGDKNATTIVATITDHGVAASTSGMTARFSMRLPNGTEYYRKTATLSGSTATVTIDEAQAASAVGRTDTAYFQLLQGSTVVASTESFTVVVLPDALADATVPESYDSAIQDAIDALDDAVEQLPSTVEDVLADHPEWTTTVQDGSITAPKLATDLARDRERLLYRLDNLLTAQLPEGETATATDAAKTPMAALALYGRSTQDGTPTPSAPVPIVSVGGNLYGFMDAPVRANVGVTWTPQADGTIKAEGTATNFSYGLGTPTTEDRGKSFFVHIEAGVPYTATSFGEVEFNVYRMKLDGTADTYIGYSKADKTFTVTEECWVAFVPRVASRTTYDATYRIALVKGTTAAPAYVPYGNAGLWARGRNLLNPAQVFSGVTFYTVNADGTLTVTVEDSRVWPSLPVAPLAAGTYTLSISGNDGGRVSYHVVDGSAETVLGIIGSGSDTFTLTSGGGVKIKVHKGTFPRTVRIQVERGSTATAYQPYESTVTPIDLDGHELRSLPDGTRDEVTVDARGHAVLVQRVGSYTVTGSEQYVGAASVGTCYRVALVALSAAPAVAGQRVYGYCTHAPYDSVSWSEDRVHVYADGNNVALFAVGSSVSDVLNAYKGAEITYHLATPVTHDLGTIDPVPLCGPDLTAQGVPSAPFALTYERDLDATLARLESAIAAIV